ncbi:hypothetical protein ACTHGU_21895 [Chitinophagaceae bacterium MMS25-I14]
MQRSAGKILILLLPCFTMLLQGCFSYWTEKEKADFAAKCAATDSVADFSFTVTGFTYEQVKTVLVYHIRNQMIIDSFYVHPDIRNYDSLRDRYWVSVDQAIYVKDTYQFVIPGQKPFLLSGMKMVMWPQWTMMSEGYGCRMKGYSVNGEKYEDGGPDFIKKGYSYPKISK